MVTKAVPQLVVNARGYYEARWREADVPRRESYRTKNLAEAQQRFGLFLLGTQPASSYTVAQAWQLRQDKGLRKVTDTDRVGYCWKALLPHFGAQDIASLRPEDIEDYIDRRLDDGVVHSTIRRELVELKATLNAMVTAKRLPVASIPHIELPPDSEARPHFLTQEQCDMILAEAAKRRLDPEEFTRLELFLLIGLHTGRRKEVIETLEWTQVDFPSDRIYFVKPGTTETNKRNGSIKMRAVLREALLKEQERRTTRWVLRMPGSIRTSFTTLMKAVDLPHVTPHTLRHTFVSLLLMRGIDLFTISKLTAVSIAQIEKTYGHLTDAHLHAALELPTP
jgi:integrase